MRGEGLQRECHHLLAHETDEGPAVLGLDVLRQVRLEQALQVVVHLRVLVGGQDGSVSLAPAGGQTGERGMLLRGGRGREEGEERFVRGRDVCGRR